MEWVFLQQEVDCRQEPRVDPRVWAEPERLTGEALSVEACRLNWPVTKGSKSGRDRVRDRKSVV